MIIAVVPARWQSTRFPGKPMELINDVPMVYHVLSACYGSDADESWIATDNVNIGNESNRIMTGVCDSGTKRVWSAICDKGVEHDDIILNIQGDEPCITPDIINELIGCIKDGANIATLSYKVGGVLAKSPHIVKVVTDCYSNALYFSREAIPHGGPYMAHLGVYGFRYGALDQIMHLCEESTQENLEQLFWLNSGYKIRVGEVEYDGRGVDVPEDIPIVEEVLRGRTLG